MLTFAHPWVALLLPLPALIWFVLPKAKANAAKIRVPFLSRIESIHRSKASLTRSGFESSWVTITNLLSWALLLTGLARPQWLEPPIERIVPTRDMQLLVDLSASMSHEDFTDQSGTTTDRLTAVQQVVKEFVQNREGDRVGLIIFGNAPFVQVPLTTDLDICSKLLDETTVGMAGPRTALGDAIGLGITSFENSDAPEKTIIALTDGNDTASSVPPIEASRIASVRDIRIHTIAIGNPELVGEEKIDTSTLQSVSENTGGESYVALNRSELSKIYDTLDQIESRDVKLMSYRPRRDVFYWFVAGAISLSLLGYSMVILFSHARLHDRQFAMQRLRVNPRTFDLELQDEQNLKVIEHHG